MGHRYPYAVLFLYHRANPVTVYHLSRFRAGAAGAPIVPLTDNGAPLEGSVDVSDVPTRCDVSNKWASVDTVVYRWFAKRNFDAERYIIVEWDCLLVGTIEAFYQPVWHESFCGKSVHCASKDNWYWFRHSEHLFAPDQNFGVAPLAGIMVTHDAMERICHIVNRDDRFLNLFCENRIATAAAQAGIRLGSFPEATGKLTAKVLQRIPNAPGIYHKVKDLRAAEEPIQF